jgi:integrase
LPQIRFDDLRHTFATLMFSNGEHAEIVQEILGHAQITLTLDTYSPFSTIGWDKLIPAC